MMERSFCKRKIQSGAAILSLLFSLMICTLSSCTEDKEYQLSIDVFSDSGLALLKIEGTYGPGDEILTRWESEFDLKGNIHEGKKVEIRAYCIDPNDKEKEKITVEIRVNGKLRDRGTGIGEAVANVVL